MTKKVILPLTGGTSTLLPPLLTMIIDTSSNAELRTVGVPIPERLLMFPRRQQLPRALHRPLQP